jgi:ADP-glucose pyrophosphorylase
MNVRSVLFDSNYEEWPGSVQSAVIDKNDHYLALLPDSVIRMPQNLDLVKTVDSLIQNHPVVFGCLSEIKDHDITKLGAVRIDLNKKIITAFQDKPQENIDLYNAFWGCYGFQGKASQELYQFLISSVNKGNNDYQALSSHPFKSFPIKSYTDLGTWENIESFRNTISQNI